MKNLKREEISRAIELRERDLKREEERKIWREHGHDAAHGRMGKPTCERR